ncbi:LCP family protein [Fundicoccus culcitae]|uniref:LCP family protein n=1 Tax=Fundicoccus culcitae TaxID=2969821 RepID=A0ABY5P4Y5_9LACT|nr:LCP family protein [Fundicoccus culcitae]UUX33670.1 LCP family protein [Fundicoccus culcitae]
MKKGLIWLVVMLFMSMLPVGMAQAEEGTSSDTASEKSFSVLLLGVDTGDLGRIEQGRSDVMQIMTVNPSEQHITLSSIPRDTYVNIPGYYMDKINHAYAFGGVELSKATVEEWLGITIDNYVVVNMSGLKEIVDAVNGITVVPPTSFSIGGYDFVEGVETRLDGEAALAYSRERYTSGGDYARQGRQREVIEAVMKEAVNPAVLANLPQLLNAFSDNIDTDLDLMDMLSLFTKYANSDYTVDNYQFTGEGAMIDGIYYEMIYDSSYTEILGYIKADLQVE